MVILMPGEARPFLLQLVGHRWSIVRTNVLTGRLGDLSDRCGHVCVCAKTYRQSALYIAAQKKIIHSMSMPSPEPLFYRRRNTTGPSRRYAANALLKHQFG